MKPIDVEGFEEKFQQNPDPWDYERSPFEAFKRNVLLAACGDGVYGRGLELGCANGVTTQRLSRICLQLDALDASPSAISNAASRDYTSRQPHFFKVTLPCKFPRNRYDLIVISEVAYYLQRQDLLLVCQAVVNALAPGGRLVLLHHLTPFADAAQVPAQAQEVMVRFFSRACGRLRRQRLGKFEVAVFKHDRR